ncbi:MULTISPECIES: tyrosine-type recombinase/integrase [Campylobacter]|uniref:tyrosine-type recombinase/integrase n=1 Tax=Campylobacter TaxID=194 RepID=UPI00036AFABD|nr:MULTISPECIES: phage integrase SAM-like domain-containing protein [Campylobacter]QKF62105.1 site-specific tyrosine recombinase, phage integrase family (INT_C_like_1 domain) [Campylobacter curvus]UEB50394.1 phage integrase N-terminal SAM-like domain-containing protein [Campylobacter curvus]
MKKEILNLLDEENADFGRLYEFYSGIEKAFINKTDNIKMGFIGNTLDKEQLERDMDYCVKNYDRNKKDKDKWRKRANILKKLNNSIPTKYYLQVVFKDTAMKIQSVMNSVNELDVQNEPKTGVIDLKNYDIPEEVIKYGILTDEKVKGGRFINNQFVPDNIAGYLESETLKKIPKSKKQLLPANNELKPEIDLLETYELYEMHEGDKQMYSDDTLGRYKKDVERLVEYMKNNNIYELKQLRAQNFQKHIKDKTSKGNANNIIGRLRKFFNYAVQEKYVSCNPFEKLSNYKVDKNTTDKRNFTLDELKELFSGKNSGIRKELLDCLRFLLLTGVRTEEFYNLNKDSFYTDCDHPFLKVKTAKQGADKIFYRNIPLHTLLKDLYKYDWIAKIKKIYSNKGTLSKALNAEIDKVIKDNTVSVHRLRGNFANAIDEYLYSRDFIEYQDTLKNLMGHSKRLRKDDIEDQVKYKITKTILGYAPDMTQGTYSQSEYADPKILAIRGLNVFEDIFEYLNIPKNQIGHVKPRKSRKTKNKPIAMIAK